MLAEALDRPALRWIEELAEVAKNPATTPEQRLSARRNLLAAITRDGKFLTRSQTLTRCSTHALATWGAV